MDCKIALISAVFWAWKRIMLGRTVDVSNEVMRWMKELPLGSGGPVIATTSGKTVSSIVANVRLNCSSSDFLGSTFVGDKHDSNVLISFGGSLVKLNDCFFFALDDGVLLDVRKMVFLLSPDDIGKSFGGLVFCAFSCCCWSCCCCCWPSEFVPPSSGSVFPAVPPSFPLLSARSLRIRIMISWVLLLGLFSVETGKGENKNVFLMYMWKNNGNFKVWSFYANQLTWKFVQFLFHFFFAKSLLHATCF